MSRNSEDDGTGGISFHWVWLLVGGIVRLVLSLESPLCGVEGKSAGACVQMEGASKKNCAARPVPISLIAHWAFTASLLG